MPRSARVDTRRQNSVVRTHSVSLGDTDTNDDDVNDDNEKNNEKNNDNVNDDNNNDNNNNNNDNNDKDKDKDNNNDNRLFTPQRRSSAEVRHGLARLAIGEVVVLLHLPLPLAGVSIGMERGCQQNDSLADGYPRQRRDALFVNPGADLIIDGA